MDAEHVWETVSNPRHEAFCAVCGLSKQAYGLLGEAARVCPGPSQAGA